MHPKNLPNGIKKAEITKVYAPLSHSKKILEIKCKLYLVDYGKYSLYLIPIF